MKDGRPIFKNLKPESKATEKDTASFVDDLCKNKLEDGLRIFASIIAKAIQNRMENKKDGSHAGLAKSAIVAEIQSKCLKDNK